jgi:DNA primase catalytic core
MILNAQDIKDKVSMADVCAHLGHKVNRKGRCACPVHGGTKPNFKTRGAYGTCFSDCGGASYDHIELLQQVRGYTYPQAVEELAQIGGMVVERSETRTDDEVARYHEAQQHRGRLQDNLQSALHLYRRPQLTEEPLDIEGRSLRPETVAAFDILISPPGNYLFDACRQGRADEDILLELGLLERSRDGRPYDVFQDRVLFPLQSHLGKVVGLAGRVTRTNTSRAKYRNSKESEIFQKSQLLYGLAQNRRAIAQSGAILVEGYWDVLTCYDRGIRRCVASMGTAVTAEQVKLLGRYTDRVTIMMDGDAAGRTAQMNSAEAFIAEGFDVRMVLLEEGQDPDSYLRERGEEGAAEFVRRIAAAPPAFQDIFTYYLDPVNIDRDQGLQAIADIVSSITNDYKTVQCEDWLEKELGKREFNLLKTRIGFIKKERQEEANRPRYTDQEYQQIIGYQIYERRNRLYATNSPDVPGLPISNFSVRPVMMVLGRSEANCLVELKNSRGDRAVVEISTDSMTELGPFKKVLLSKGNYVFDEAAKPFHFIRIQRWIFDNIRHCYPLTTLGWNERGGFYAWANGLSLPDGNFKPVDEYGIVEHGDHRFFLPAFSSVHVNNPGDDAGNGYENMRDFALDREVRGQDTLTLREWSELFVAVHGKNGMIGLAFYFSCLYRSMIFAHFDVFPLLNLFGPPGLGKSYMAASLAALFGRPKKPFNLHEGTDVGLFRRIAQKRDAIEVLEEFNNMISPKRFQALKNFYDGSGREKGQKTTDNRTTTTRVETGIVMVGQQQPTQDAAMFSRVISLNFGPRTFSPEQIAAARRLKAIEGTGTLSRLTAGLLRHRELIAQRFLTVYDHMAGRLRSAVPPTAPRNIAPRLVKNNAIVLAVFQLVSEVEELAFTVDDLFEVVQQVMVGQLHSIAQEDDLAGWWDQIEFAITSKHELRYDNEIDVVLEDSLNAEVSTDAGMEKRRHRWADGPRKVLYLHMNSAYQVYSQSLRRTGKDNGMPKSSIQHYLRGSEAYLGEKAHKINGRARRVYCFDLGQLPFDLQTSDERYRQGLPGLAEAPPDPVPPTTSTTNSATVAATSPALTPEEDLPF